MKKSLLILASASCFIANVNASTSAECVQKWTDLTQAIQTHKLQPEITSLLLSGFHNDCSNKLSQDVFKTTSDFQENVNMEQPFYTSALIATIFNISRDLDTGIFGAEIDLTKLVADGVVQPSELCHAIVTMLIEKGRPVSIFDRKASKIFYDEVPKFTSPEIQDYLKNMRQYAHNSVILKQIIKKNPLDTKSSRRLLGEKEAAEIKTAEFLKQQATLVQAPAAE